MANLDTNQEINIYTSLGRTTFVTRNKNPPRIPITNCQNNAHSIPISISITTNPNPISIITITLIHTVPPPRQTPRIIIANPIIHKVSMVHQSSPIYNHSHKIRSRTSINQYSGCTKPDASGNKPIQSLMEPPVRSPIVVSSPKPSTAPLPTIPTNNSIRSYT